VRENELELAFVLDMDQVMVRYYGLRANAGPGLFGPLKIKYLTKIFNIN